MASADKSLQILKNTTVSPFIPPSLIKYAERCVTQQFENRFTHRLMEKPAITVRAINQMFKNASAITCMSPEDILRATDFNPNDKDPYRIEAAFAEIRAISFLNSMGFYDIRPLISGVSKEADLMAKHGSRSFAIEVADSIFDATNRSTCNDLQVWAVRRARDEGKLSQIDATRRRQNCSRGAFIFAVDTLGPTLWFTQEDFLLVVKGVWQDIGAPCRIHVGCFTGLVSFGNIPDDVIYPPPEQNLVRCLWSKLFLWIRRTI